MNKYEVLWYEVDALTNRATGDPFTKEFRTHNAAMNFYNRHKEDVDKCDWWVTKRDKDGYVIEDLVY